MKQILTILLSFLLIHTALASCSKGGSGSSPEVEKAVIADLKMEIEINASKEVRVSIVATKGIESDIYRDGKLVSQGNYSPESELVKNLRTSISHRGQILVVTLGFMEEDIDEDEAPVNVNIKARLYRGNKLVQEYKQERVLSSESRSAIEQLSLSGKE